MSFVSQNKGRTQFISSFMRPSNHKESLDGALCVHCFGGFRIDHRWLTGKDTCIFGKHWMKNPEEILSVNKWIFILNGGKSNRWGHHRWSHLHPIRQKWNQGLVNWSFTTCSCMRKRLNIKWGQTGAHHDHEIIAHKPEQKPWPVQQGNSEVFQWLILKGPVHSKKDYTHSICETQKKKIRRLCWSLSIVKKHPWALEKALYKWINYN